MGLPGSDKKSDHIFSRLDRIHECDGQIEGWTDGHRATVKTALTHSVTR